MAKTLTQREAAEFFGVSLNTVRNWGVRGMPSKKGQGNKLEYSPKEILEWHVEQAKATAAKVSDGVPAKQIEDRASWARMRLAEVDLALKEGDAISIADVSRATADIITRAKSRAMPWPDRNALAVTQGVIDALGIDATGDQIEAGRIRAHQILTAARDELLIELANDVPDDENGEDEPIDRAA